MSAVLEILAGLGALALLVAAFLRTSPTALASGLRLMGPVLLGLAGFAVVGIGKAGAGSFMVAAALGWFGATRLVQQKPKPTAGGRSMVRTAALEMELDHETGALEGLVLSLIHI